MFLLFQSFEEYNTTAIINLVGIEEIYTNKNIWSSLSCRRHSPDAVVADGATGAPFASFPFFFFFSSSFRFVPLSL